MTNKQVILIIEDEKNIGNYIETIVISNGYKALRAMNGMSGLSLCTSHHPDLILLDLGLPDIDGGEVLERVRGFSAVPVIVISARTQEGEKVQALDKGADDYITKPFGIMEFISRVKAVLRRTNSSGDGVLALGQIQMDDQKRQVWSESSLCELTYKEYELLKFFLQNPGIVLSREKLINRVWGIDYEGESRTVDMHVKTLRQKLGSQGALIKTIRNVGYKIEV